MLKAASIVTTIALALAWCVYLRPAFLGGTAHYILVSGISMEPKLYTGDLAVMRKQPTYAKGDVLAFQVQGGVVIHRVIGGDATKGYRMQGDNRSEPDMWRPTPSNIGGKMWFHIPKVGLAIALVRQPGNLPVFAGFAGAFLVLMGGGKKQRQKRLWRPGEPAHAVLYDVEPARRARKPLTRFVLARNDGTRLCPLYETSHAHLYDLVPRSRARWRP